MSALDPSAPGLPLAGGGSGGGFANPMTTRGDLIRGGVGGTPERVAAKTAGNVVTGDGTDVVSATIATPLAVAPAANRAALGTGADPMTGAAWTDNASAGTSVTWAGGVLTTNINAGTTGGPSTLNASDITLANLSSGSWTQIAPNAESPLGSTLTWEVYAIQSRSPMGWTP